jgi:hypothetical protein
LEEEIQVAKKWLIVTAVGLALGTSTLRYVLRAAPQASQATPPASSHSSSTPSLPDLGVNADLRGYRPLPDDNPWNTRVDELPLDPKSDVYVASIGRDKGLHPDFGANWNGGPFGIPYVVVDRSTPRLPLSFEYSDESDPGPYPIPQNAPIEGGENSDGDRHVIVLDRDSKKLYETWSSQPQKRDGKIVSWQAGSGAIFDLSSNKLRPAGWTSADAAGLPIFPGLVRFDEVARGEIRHALRFTVRRTQRGYIAPATHWASRSSDRNLPPMGLRLRLRRDFDISGFPPRARVVLQAMKTYGLIVADNGGDWFVSGAPDARWNDDELNTLKSVRGREFEVVQTGKLITE